MEYKNVLEQLEDFCSNFKNLLLKESKLGAEPWQSLLDELLGIKDLLNDPIISEPIDNLSLQKVSPIDKLGLGTFVIALAEDGLNSFQIANQLRNQGLEISDSQVKAWITEYKEASITEKRGKVNTSVFDTQGQLQEIFDRLQFMLETIEAQDQTDFLAAKVTRQQVELDYMKEIRQTVKDAAQLAATVASMQQVEQFQRVVLEQINQVDPNTHRKIMAKLREAKAMFSTLKF